MSRDFKGFQGVSWFSMLFEEFQRISRDFKGFQGISRNFKGFQGISRGFKSFQFAKLYTILHNFAHYNIHACLHASISISYLFLMIFWGSLWVGGRCLCPRLVCLPFLQCHGLIIQICGPFRSMDRIYALKHSILSCYKYYL